MKYGSPNSQRPSDRFAKASRPAQMLSGRYKDLPPDAVLGIAPVPERGLFGEKSTPEAQSLCHYAEGGFARNSRSKWDRSYAVDVG